jgi:putative FmdB family regulatory protein
MPIYEFFCKSCNQVYEEQKQYDDFESNCPICHAKTEKITGVLVTPLCNATVIPSQYFIGSMDPDDVFSASFDIYADTVDYGKQTIGFTVSFKQGNDYYETPVVSKTFSVVSGPGTSYQSSGSSTSQSGLNGMPSAPSLTTCVVSFLIIIVVIVVIVILFLKWKKRQKAK